MENGDQGGSNDNTPVDEGLDDGDGEHSDDTDKGSDRSDEDGSHGETDMQSDNGDLGEQNDDSFGDGEWSELCYIPMSYCHY